MFAGGVVSAPLAAVPAAAAQTRHGDKAASHDAEPAFFLISLYLSLSPQPQRAKVMEMVAATVTPVVLLLATMMQNTTPVE